MTTGEERASRLLGPLEARIMQTAWSGRIADRFTVREMQQTMPGAQSKGVDKATRMFRGQQGLPIGIRR